jgi:hypothetical protein
MPSYDNICQVVRIPDELRLALARGTVRLLIWNPHEIIYDCDRYNLNPLPFQKPLESDA